MVYTRPRLRRVIPQKIQCTFKTDIPDLGYLDGGSDRDVCRLFNRGRKATNRTVKPADKSDKQNATAVLVGHNVVVFVRVTFGSIFRRG